MLAFSTVVGQTQRDMEKYIQESGRGKKRSILLLMEAGQSRGPTRQVQKYVSDFGLGWSLLGSNFKRTDMVVFVAANTVVN